MSPSVDLLLVDPGGDRQVTVPQEARIERLADRLAGYVHERPGAGWGLRRAGQATSLPGDRTLREAGIEAGERIELVAPGALADPHPPSQTAPAPPEDSPLPPPRSRPLPPPPTDRSRRGGGLVVVTALAALVLLAAGAAYGTTRLFDDSGDDSTALAPVDWGSGVNAGGFEEVSEDSTEVEPGVTEEAGDTEDEIPELSRDEFREEVGDLLLAHHTAIVEGEYQKAWELLSNRKRRQYLSEGSGYPTWRRNQSTLATYLRPAGLQVSILTIDRQKDVVTVRLSGMTWSAPGSPCSEWSGVTWVRYERGGWYYDPGYSTTPNRERDWKSKYAQLLGGSC